MINPNSHLDIPFLSKSKRFSRVAAVITFGVSLAVLGGWALNIAVFKSVIPGLIEMQPLTAVAFMLTGTALWLLREQNAETWQYRMGRLCAGGTTVICAVVLCEFAVNASIGIDGLLFHDSVISEIRTTRAAPQ
jgi:hypothetical protein